MFDLKFWWQIAGLIFVQHLEVKQVVIFEFLSQSCFDTCWAGNVFKRHGFYLTKIRQSMCLRFIVICWRLFVPNHQFWDLILTFHMIRNVVTPCVNLQSGIFPILARLMWHLWRLVNKKYLPRFLQIATLLCK